MSTDDAIALVSIFIVVLFVGTSTFHRACFDVCKFFIKRYKVVAAFVCNSVIAD